MVERILVEAVVPYIDVEKSIANNESLYNIFISDLGSFKVEYGIRAPDKDN